MLRTIHPGAITLGAHRTAAAGAQRAIIAVAMTLAVLTAAGCGESKKGRDVAKGTPDSRVTPAVVSDTAPATATGSVIPENVSYE